MKLEITGNAAINKYYAQTLCMLFFPGAKFSDGEPELPETPRVLINVDLDSETDEFAAYAEIISGTRRESATHRTGVDENGRSPERNAKIAAGAAFFECGKAMFRQTPPWGMLTGVRPSKIAAEFLSSGMDQRSVKAALKAEYYVNPKKASLACDVASNEYRLLEKMGDQSKKCSVYISIPFCPTRCAYCSFVSYSTARLLSMIPDYVVRLCSDIRRMFAQIKSLGFEVQTVYIGGGTPTILTPAQLETLLSCVNNCCDVSSLLEFTLEAGRPDTVTAEKLAIAREYGVTRVSINPQTLSDELLEAIGRRHTAEDFYRAFDIAKTSGIRVINTDLIAGLPGDRFVNFSQTVDKILALAPENVTYHTFCVKRSSSILAEDSEIYKRGGGDTGKCVDYAQLKARQNGYLPYYMYRQKNTVGNFENVGYAKAGTEGLYNILIMEEIHSIFAVGAGSVTKLISPSHKGELAGFNKTRESDVKSAKGEVMKRLFMPKYPYEYLAMTDTPEKLDGFFGEIDSYFRDK